MKDHLFALLTELGNIPPDQIIESATVDEDLQINSVAFVELQVAIEDEYDIQIDPIRIVELNELGAIIDYVHQCATAGAR